MATGNMHNLTTLIKRLEAATSRLEDIATSNISLDGPSSEPAAVANGVAVPRSHADSSPVPSSNPITTASPSSPPSAAPSDVTIEVEEYDNLINVELAKFIGVSEKLDPLLGEQSKEVKGAFQAQREFLNLATKTRKPDPMSAEFRDLLKDTQTQMLAVDELRTKNRGSNLKDHLAMVADGVGVLGWVTLDTKPAEMAAELFGGAQMYGNKILKQYKDKDATQVEWVQAYYALIRALVAIVKQHYPRGVQWNPQGVSPAESLQTAAQRPIATSAPSVRAGGPPPPPPPPPPEMLTAGITKAAPAKTTDMGAVFGQLNKGENVTSGLRKVDPSQMTHKNPSLRAAAPVPERSNSTSSSRSTGPSTKPKPESMRTKKPPRKELDGSKWIIENYDSPGAPVEIEVETNHSILITKCKNTIIRVIGKGNAITIDSSTKTSIVLDSLVSSVDVIKCPSFALQVLGMLPTILLDQIDGATIYLSKDSLATEVFTSKCSSVNIYLPPTADAEDDYSENSVPEQFRSYIKDGKLVTEIVEHKG